jgi:hypothetical protein
MVRAPREPIASQPAPDWPRLPGVMYRHLFPFLPQQAGLQGSLLIVERFQEVSQCDLVSAARVTIRFVKPILSGMG